MLNDKFGLTLVYPFYSQSTYSIEVILSPQRAVSSLLFNLRIRAN